MVYDSGYKTCMCYITNHFETTIIDINMPGHTFSMSSVSIYDKVGCLQSNFGIHGLPEVISKMWFIEDSEKPQ